ncbi:MAG: roadblock/LC7 domain-containing protein, partial [Promethearchaeota archaeon]
MEKLFRELLRNFIIDVDGVEAVAICDRDGFIIDFESREESEESENDSFIGVISAAIDSSIERIKKEFGESNFLNITSIEKKKFAFASMGPRSILTAVANPSTTDVELRVYSEHIAGKIE